MKRDRRMKMKKFDNEIIDIVERVEKEKLSTMAALQKDIHDNAINHGWYLELTPLGRFSRFGKQQQRGL